MKRSRASTLVLAAFAVWAVTSCDDDPDDGSQFGRQDGGDAVPTDAEALGFALEANTDEVSTADVALARAQMAPTMAFASRMVNEHTGANQRLLALASGKGLVSSDSALRRAIASQTQQSLSQLWAAAAGDFDLTYARSALGLHMQVLAMLDGQLLPAVRDADLRAELTLERAAVAEHVTAAQALVAQLGSAGGADAGAGGSGGIGSMGGAGGTSPGGSGGSDPGPGGGYGP
jgi:putative membrane protein